MLTSFSPYQNRYARHWSFLDQKGKKLYVVVRDIFGNLIHHRLVELVSGPEVYKHNFKDQFDAGQLYPGQRIRLEVSLP